MGLVKTVARYFAGADATPPGAGDDYWYQGRGTASGSGIKVTPDIAIKVSCLFACLKILAESVSSLTLQMRKTIPGGSEEAPNHPLEEIIRYQPNNRQTAIDFWEMMVFQAILNGNAYAEIVPGARGSVHQLIPFDYDYVTPRELPNHNLVFRVTDNLSGTSRVLLQEEMFRINGMSKDGVTGLRLVDVAAEAIGLGYAADQYASRIFSNSLNIGGFLTHPQKLSPEGQKNLIDELMKKFSSPFKAHRPMLLMEGMTFTAAQMNARDAQLIEARKWQLGELARFFRIPLHMLGIYEGSTKSNVEEQSINFVKYTLRPLTRRIEQAIRRDLIVAKQAYFAAFYLDDLLEGDSEARSKYFSAAMGSGGHKPWMTANEVRRREGMNPMTDDPEADKLIAPNNNQVPGQNGKPLPAPNDNAAAALPEPAPPLMVVDDLLARANRLVVKEGTAVSKANIRHADNREAFRTWVKAFYGGHVSTVIELLGIDKESARVYCDYQRDELLKTNDVEGLLERREDSRAREIANTIRKAGEKHG